MNCMMTTREAAEALGLAPATLEAWRMRGKLALPWVRIGTRAVRYRREDVLAFIERGAAAAAEVAA